MAHSNTRRPRSTAAALIATGVVLAVATTSMPISPPTTLAAPRISTDTVRLAVLPLPMPTPTTAVAADVPTDIPNAIAQGIRNALGKILAGAGSGVVLGFVGAGVFASNVIYRIPVLGQALAPLITVIALAGAIVGAPIGAVLGALSLLPPPPIHLPAAGRKAVPTPHRTTKAGSRPNRQITSVSSTANVSAPQQNSGVSRTGAHSARHAVSKRVGQH